MPFNFEMFKYPITAPFGHTGRMHPTPHTGVDIATPVGTKAQALFTGRITDIKLDDPILGKAVYLTNSYGETLEYGHLSDVMVYEGQQVVAGHVLGFTGNTGRSSGEHLHLSLFDKGGNVLDITSITSGSVIDRIADRIAQGFAEVVSSSGYFLLDCFKTVIIAYMVWSCYSMMMNRTRFGLPPFSDARPMDALAMNGMFFAIVTIAQVTLR